MSNSYTTRDEQRDVLACIGTIVGRVEECRERSLAVTKLEEAALWLGALASRQEDAELNSAYED